MKTKGIKIALMGGVALAGVSAIVMLLWNALLPEIFGVTPINFWQALGLFILTRIFFGRFGFGGDKMRYKENLMREKWKKMTPEQRKEFINKRRRFGFGHPCRMKPFDMEQHEEQDNGNT